MSVEHSESNTEKINGQLQEFIESIDVEIKIQKQRNKGVADLLTDFKQSCERRLAGAVRAAIVSSEPQRLAALSVDMSVKDDRWRIINDAFEVLRVLIGNTSLSLGKSSYALNEFIILEKEDASGFDDGAIIVDFVLPASIRTQLLEITAVAAAEPQSVGEPQINGSPASQLKAAEPLVVSPERTVDKNANKNAAFAERLPNLLNGIDPELAQLVLAAAKNSPGTANIIVELPTHMNKKEVRRQLNERFGSVAYAQNHNNGANAIQITVN